MREDDVKITVCPGLCSMLFITFLVLKLTKVIDWSWWWITAPLWMLVAAFLLVVAVILVVALIADIAIHGIARR